MVEPLTSYPGTSILVLEDDDMFRDVIRNILRAAGFNVICVCNFNEAIMAVEGNTKIDMALIDVGMPAGTPHGVTFARMAKLRRPFLKIIFMSGRFRLEDLMMVEADEVFLHKPFAPDLLVETVARMAA